MGWKMPTIAAKILEINIKLGGLKMPNIFLKVKSWQLSWLKRAANLPWLNITNELLPGYNLTQLINSNFNLNHKSTVNLPFFYKNLVESEKY